MRCISRTIGVLEEFDVETHGEYRYHVFRLTDWHGEPSNLQPEEHAEIQWFSEVEAVELDLAHPDYPDLFRKVEATQLSGT